MTDNYLKWAIVIILTILSLLILALPIFVYKLTGNWLTLMPIVSLIPIGQMWKWIVQRIFPLNKQDHERELMRINRSSTKHNKRIYLRP